MKKSITILLIAIIFILEKSIAQFNTVWTSNYQHTATNGFSNESRKVVTDPSGNSYVLADVTSNKDPNGIITTQTFHYTVLSKYSPAGALLNSQSIKVFNHNVNGFDNLGAFGLEIDASNNLYIGYITHDPVKNFDVNLAKYNSALVLQWVRTYNASSSDIGVDMTVAGSAAYAIVKSVSGVNTTYRIVGGNSSGTNDTALYNFTANTEVLNGIASKSGVIYATGYRLVSGVKSVMTVKINSQGSLKWTNIFNGGSATGDDFGKAIVVSPSGAIFVTGTSDRGAPTGKDVMIIKLQGSGSFVWSRYRDFNGSVDNGLFIEAIDNNHVYVGSNSYYDVILDQVDANMGITGGRVIYHPVPASTYSYLNGCTLTDFKVSSNYGFYLTGSTLATDASNRVFSASYLVKFVFADPSSKKAFKIDSDMPIAGDFVTSKAGTGMAFNFFNNDVMWLEDVISPYDTHGLEMVSISDLSMTSPLRGENAGTKVNLDAGDIIISPNPADRFISMKSKEKITKIELLDITGKSVKIIEINSEIVKMDLSDLMKGIYIGKIHLESGTVSTRKIIKN